MRPPFIALLCLLAALSGCAHPMGRMRQAFREPGEKLTDLPDAVARDLGCAERPLPHVALERNEINPERVRAGGEFNHRLVYALCPAEPTAVVAGTLTTRIRFKGRVLVTDRVEGYELKPGRWIVDSSVALPPSAEPGVYALEWDFEGPGVNEGATATFGVR